MIEKLVEQIESRFNELSEQMADPEVISDRDRYAEVGRSYRQLEPAHELAREYRQAADDAAGRARRGDPPGDGGARPERREERDRRDPRRHRWGGGRAVRRRPLPDARPLRGATRVQDRAALGGRRLVHLRDPRERRLQRL